MDAIVNIDERRQRLKNLEDLALEGVGLINRGKNQVTLAVLAIQEDGLWTVAEDDDGHPYQTFAAYMDDLADRLGFARSTLFDYKSIGRLALVNKLAESPDDFIEKGGLDFYRPFQRQSEYNQYTGEITGIKGNPDCEDPVGLMQEAARQVSPDLRPRDRYALVKELVLPPESHQVRVDLDLVNGSKKGETLVRWFIKFKMTNGTEKAVEGFIEDGNVPEPVLDELKSLIYRGRHS